MSLNIKNADAEHLARMLADATGESITAAVTAAVRERLDRARGSDEAKAAARVHRLHAIAADAAGRWIEPYRSADHGDLLYDQTGAPR